MEEQTIMCDNHNKNHPIEDRKNFSTADDLIILRSINIVRLWESPIGTKDGLTKSYEDVAEKCKEFSGFIAGKTGPAIKTRFEKLLKSIKDSQLKSMRASGTSEEYTEREQLIQDITLQIDNWKVNQDAKTNEKRRKKQAIESSGLVMRKLAMGVLYEDISDLDSITSDQSTSIRTSLKRSYNDDGIKKISKRQKHSVLTDSISASIMNLNQENNEKYQHLKDRLEFDRVEAEKKREHEDRLELLRADFEFKHIQMMADLEMKREERYAALEQKREERQAATEMRRDQILLEIMKLLKQKKSE